MVGPVTPPLGAGVDGDPDGDGALGVGAFAGCDGRLGPLGRLGLLGVGVRTAPVLALWPFADACTERARVTAR